MKSKKPTNIQLKKSCNCPIETPMAIIGKKWSINILRDLFEGNKRFKDFLDSNKNLSTKMLSARLRELEHQKFIEKKIISITPLLAQYTLVKKGRALNKVLYEIASFAYDNCVEELGKLTLPAKEQELKSLKAMLRL